MRKIIFISLLVIVLGTGGYMVVKGGSNETTTQQQSATLSEKVVTGGGQLIDVRTPEEFAASHAVGAVNIPLDTIEKGDLSGFDNGKAIYLYCRSGNRAGQAKVILEKAGFDDITNIGGLDDWQSQGGKVS